VTPGTPNGRKAFIARITGQDGSYLAAPLPAHRSGSFVQGQAYRQRHRFNSDRATT
jgi:GDP-D-mannose dehydratase